MLKNIGAMIGVTAGLIGLSLFVALLAGVNCLGGNCESSLNYTGYALFGLTAISALWTAGLIIQKLIQK